MFAKIQALVGYIKARLNERSTWVAFGAGVAAASALPMPWSIVFCTISIIGIFIPDGKAIQPKA